VAGAAAIVIAVGLWLFGLWADERAEDNWAQFQASVVKSISH
jgi:high-affinity Fe2+/Pb2+ permease